MDAELSVSSEPAGNGEATGAAIEAGGADTLTADGVGSGVTGTDATIDDGAAPDAGRPAWPVAKLPQPTNVTATPIAPMMRTFSTIQRRTAPVIGWTAGAGSSWGRSRTSDGPVSPRKHPPAVRARLWSVQLVQGSDKLHVVDRRARRNRRHLQRRRGKGPELGVAGVRFVEPRRLGCSRSRARGCGQPNRHRSRLRTAASPR